MAPLGYKAFLVGVNREACAKYKRALDRHLPPDWSVPIYTKNDADVVDRPLVAELQVSPEREADTRRTFKKADAAPHLLIVTDKLLTGYDAPLLYCLYLDKPMRDHVLLQAIARVNRPCVDASGARKRVGLVVDFVGVLRELWKALRFDSSDVSGGIEDLDVLMQDFHHKIAGAEADYLQDTVGSSADERLERVIYGRFLEPEARKAFFEAYKEIEALWEILSPAPELRGRIETFKRLAQLYDAVRNAYAENVSYAADLARKTHSLVAESAIQEGLGYRTRAVTFDLRTLEALRNEPGPDEAKVFNLVRGLRQEIASEPNRQPVLLPLKERAERILKDLSDRTASGLEALERLAVLARAKETATAAAKASGLSARAFGLHWTLKDDTGLRAAGIATLDLAQRAEALLDRFPNAAVNADEQRRLRAALYAPLLDLDNDARNRVVERIVAILLGTDSDADA